MKFKGQPNLLVRINKPMKGEVKHFAFDYNGIYETNHQTTIKRLQANFEEVIEKVEESKKFHCKKCEYETENKSELMRHYKEHKEE